MIHCFLTKNGSSEISFSKGYILRKVTFTRTQKVTFCFSQLKKVLIVFCKFMAENAQIYIKKYVILKYEDRF